MPGELITKLGDFQMGHRTISVCVITGHRDLWLLSKSETGWGQALIAMVRRPCRGTPRLLTYDRCSWDDWQRLTCLASALTTATDLHR